MHAGGKFRLVPEPGTLQGYGEECEQLVIYPSSLRQEGTNAQLLTLAVKGGRGMRLTKDQVLELVAELEGWLIDVLCAS
jgi:hypothetical protein